MEKTLDVTHSGVKLTVTLKLSYRFWPELQNPSFPAKQGFHYVSEFST